MSASSFNCIYNEKEGVTNVEVSHRDGNKFYPRLSVVHRSLLEKWDADVGAYVLMSPTPDGEGRYGVYVGESTRGGVSERIKTHDRNPPAGMEKWAFAVVVHGQQKGDKSGNLTYEQAQGLEHFLYKASKSSSANCMNKKPPSEVKLYEAERDMLKSFISYVFEVIKILGCDINRTLKKPNRILEKPEKNSSSYLTFHSTDLADLIKTGLIKVGTKLVSISKSYPCKAEIVDVEGNIQVLRCGKEDNGDWIMDVSSDTNYKCDSPSGAARAALDLHGNKRATNGWDFWRLEEDPKTSLKHLRDQHDTPHTEGLPSPLKVS